MAELFRVVTTTRQHCEHIAKNIRLEDARELFALAHLDPLPTLLASIELSNFNFTGIFKDEPIFIFGVAQSMDSSIKGNPWMLSTCKLKQCRYGFLRLCKPYINEMFKIYEILENYVDCRNTESIKWLKWLGFKFREPVAYGVENYKFMYFSKERK